MDGWWVIWFGYGMDEVAYSTVNWTDPFGSDGNVGQKGLSMRAQPWQKLNWQ
jgi:hypothetical protein